IERNVCTVNGREYVLRILPYQTLKGHIDGVVMTFVDVTNVIQARAEIVHLTEVQAQRTNELEAMLAMLPVGIAICDDSEGRHVRTNRVGAEILGVMENANISGHDPARLFTLHREGEALSQAELPIERALLTGNPIEEELRVMRADGTSRDIEFSAWPVFNQQDKTGGAVGVFTDVTERKRELEAQATQHTIIAKMGVFALYENDVAAVMRRLLKEICATLYVDHAEIWKLRGDKDHTLLLEMSTACGSGQLSETSVKGDLESPIGRTLIVGKPVVVENPAPEQVYAQLPHLSAQGVACTVSAPIRHGDDTYGVLSVHHRQRRQFLPFETHFLQSLADLLSGVVRRKQLEIGHGQAQRRQGFADAEERMRQAERLASLGTLAAGIAHEVNNPLNSILMNAELGLISLKRPDAHEKLTRLLTTIIREAQRGGSITRNVLHFSKADHYTPKGQADLNNVIGRVREHVASVLQKHNARLDLELDQTLPRLELNQIAMEQAMVNLISNAAQSGASRINVRINGDGQYICMVVNDDGRGIAQEELEHIFDPFYTTRRSQGGSGLGLSLVHRIVADHNGTVEAHSAPGEGTRFVIRLPFPRN
ncbi:MAG TPA: ATP-binding protein, partial [Gammaproteobacteria bacterium]|nr:ATP-binding protein [Gammaproteobacteria bacterium]